MNFVSHKKKVIIAALLCLALVGACIFLLQPKAAPPDLGPQLQYTGSYTSRCLFVCDTPTWTTYYFATSLSREEVISYFKRVRLYPSSARDIGYSGDYTYEALSFSLKDKTGSFEVIYYDKTNAALLRKEKNLPTSPYPNIVEVKDKYMTTAREAY